jgi:hypothetical protein
MHVPQLLPCRMCGNPVSPSAKVCLTCAAPYPTPPKGLERAEDTRPLHATWQAVRIVVAALVMMNCR